jgi:hypothetical protein
MKTFALIALLGAAVLLGACDEEEEYEYFPYNNKPLTDADRALLPTKNRFRFFYYGQTFTAGPRRQASTKLTPAPPPSKEINVRTPFFYANYRVDSEGSNYGSFYGLGFVNDSLNINYPLSFQGLSANPDLRLDTATYSGVFRRQNGKVDFYVNRECGMLLIIEKQDTVFKRLSN